MITAVKPNRGRQLWTPNEVAQLMAWRDAGKTFAQIAAALGRTRWACKGKVRDMKYAGYNAADDFAKSIDACYEAIRARRDAGGPDWTPPDMAYKRERS